MMRLNQMLLFLYSEFQSPRHEELSDSILQDGGSFPV